MANLCYRMIDMLSKIQSDGELAYDLLRLDCVFISIICFNLLCFVAEAKHHGRMGA